MSIALVYEVKYGWGRNRRSAGFFSVHDQALDRCTALLSLGHTVTILVRRKEGLHIAALDVICAE